MAKKPTPTDRPTRRTIESLLRERNVWASCSFRWKQLHKELEELEKKILNSNAAYRKLREKTKRVYREAERLVNDIRNQHKVCQRLYLSKGITAEVLREIDKLVTLQNKFKEWDV